MNTLNRFGCGVLIVSVLIYSEAVKGMISIGAGPQNTVIREGETATLECTVQGKGRNDIVRWYRVTNGDFTALSRDRDIEPVAAPAAGMYQIVGRSSQYNLQITNVNRRDSGEYRCGFQKGQSITSEGAELEVVVPPDITSPTCFMMPVDAASSAAPGFYRMGDVVSLICISLGGKPPATLSWKRGRTSLVPKTPSMARVELEIDLSDIDKEFTCYAESPALDAPRSCSLTPARSPPDVRITPDSASIALQGGITFACGTEGAVPPDSSYTWLLNGNAILKNGRRRFEVSPDTRSLTVTNIRESENGTVVTCQLNTPEGFLSQAEATVTVIGVQQTSDIQTTWPTAQQTTQSTSSSTPLSSSVTPSPSTTSEMISPSEVDDTTHGMPKELIIVSAVAGLAIGLLAIILIAYIVKKHRERQARKANQHNRNYAKSTPNSRPAMEVHPMKQVQPVNGVQLSEDGYTILRKPNNSSSGDYETVGSSVLPSAPKLDQTDNDLYWDYEIPYSTDHSRDQAMAVNNPVYLEIIE